MDLGELLASLELNSIRIAIESDSQLSGRHSLHAPVVHRRTNWSEKKLRGASAYHRGGNAGLASQALEHEADLVLGRLGLACCPANFSDRLLGTALAAGVCFIAISPSV